MTQIPGASIHDIDWARIQRQFPEAAGELARLGDLMAHGRESPDEFIALIRLLCDVGESGEAEDLLRHNVVDEGDLCHRTYVALFGHRTTDEFTAAVCAFAEQFGVSLSQPVPRGFLRSVCSSHPQPGQSISDPSVARLLRAPAEVEFRYESGGTTADVASDLPELVNDYVILQRTPAGWARIGGSEM